MSDIARAKLVMHWLHFAAGELAQLAIQLIQSRARANRHIINIPRRGLRGGGEEIGLNHVSHVTKVAAGFAIAINFRELAAQQLLRPARDHRGVRALRILSRTKHIEITQANQFLSVTAAENLRVQFVHHFADGVWRKQRAGDRLDVGSAQSRQPALGQSRKVVDLPEGGATLRFLVGPDAFRFSSEAMTVFTHSRYRVGPDSNRMGYRLLGKTLEMADDSPILSSATPSGTIQIPPSGEPILLMADHQTTGGYAKIGIVITVDLAAAGQLAPGDWITFEACDHGEAVAALIAIEQALWHPA